MGYVVYNKRNYEGLAYYPKESTAKMMTTRHTNQVVLHLLGKDNVYPVFSQWNDRFPEVAYCSMTEYDKILEAHTISRFVVRVKHETKKIS